MFLQETLVRFVSFCSSSVYHHHISVPLCGNVWRLRPWLDHVPICFVAGAEWKETAKLQRGWRGKNQFSEDSVVKVDVVWRLKVPVCAWKYECFPFDQKFLFAFLEISSCKWNSRGLLKFSKNFWSGISIPYDAPPRISGSFGWVKSNFGFSRHFPRNFHTICLCFKCSRCFGWMESPYFAALSKCASCGQFCFLC